MTMALNTPIISSSRALLLARHHPGREQQIGYGYDCIQRIIRHKTSEESLEPYQFDYLLLCAKICGTSHYNMQMKIVVESEKDYEKWVAKQQIFSEVIQ
jgi:hypothetical protein